MDIPLSKLCHDHHDLRGQLYTHSHLDALEEHSHPILDARRLLDEQVTSEQEAGAPAYARNTPGHQGSVQTKAKK